MGHTYVTAARPTRVAFAGDTHTQSYHPHLKPTEITTMANHINITLCTNHEVLDCEPELVQEIYDAGAEKCLQLLGRRPECNDTFQDWQGNGRHTNGVQLVSLPAGFVHTSLGDVACEIKDAMYAARDAAIEREARSAVQDLELGSLVSYDNADVLGEQVIRDLQEKLRSQSLGFHDDGCGLRVCWIWAKNGDRLDEPSSDWEQPLTGE